MSRILMVAGFALVAACSDGEPPPAADTEPPATDGVFEPLTDTLDRAAGVEDTLRDAAEERRRQLEAAE